MKDHLEPKLVSLMDRDEQQFVMMFRIGKAILQPDQLRDAKVLVIRKQGVVAVVVGHDDRRWTMDVWLITEFSMVYGPSSVVGPFRMPLPRLRVWHTRACLE